MTKFSRLYLLFTCMVFATQLFAETQTPPSQDSAEHYDELRVNSALRLSDVLDQAYARAPMQASLTSRNAMVLAKGRIAKAVLPAAPAINLMHQNDALADGRGEREWHAELELPVWLPGQRDGRFKVADASQSSIIVSRQSLKLQVAGQVRESLWNIALNDSNAALFANKLQVASKLQQDVSKRYLAGELAKTDAMLAEQETLRAEKDKLRADAELMHARHQYYLITGLRELPVNYEEIQSAYKDYSQSPIWLEAQSKLILAEKERDLASVESYENPQLILNARNIRGAFDVTGNDSLGVKVRIPFGGDARAAPIKAAAEVSVGNALSERETLRLALEAAMHEAEHNLAVSRAEFNIAAKQYEIAKESLRLAQKAFQLGETDLVSLLRVQAQTFEAERAFVTRQVQVQWDVARYNQTVGVLP
jgi:outer membrane protein TolC